MAKLPRYLISQSRVIAKGKRIRDVQRQSIPTGAGNHGGLRRAAPALRSAVISTNITGTSIPGHWAC